MKTQTILIALFLSCFACKKSDIQPTPTIFEYSSSGPIRYRDSIFATVRTDTLQNVFYRQVNNYDGVVNLALDAYLPPSTDTATSRAAIIFFHGGAFSRTAIVNGIFVEPRKTVSEICIAYAKRGFVVIAPSYRLGIEPGAPDYLQLEKLYSTIYRAVQDARAAIRFVKLAAAAAKIDTNRIFVGGGSAGAITALHAVCLDNSEIPGGSFGQWGPLDGNSQYDYQGASIKVKGILNHEGMLIDSQLFDASDAPVLSTYGRADSFYN